jgi:hypothetical protein
MNFYGTRDIKGEWSRMKYNVFVNNVFVNREEESRAM